MIIILRYYEAHFNKHQPEGRNLQIMIIRGKKTHKESPWNILSKNTFLNSLTQLFKKTYGGELNLETIEPGSADETPFPTFKKSDTFSQESLINELMAI